MMNFDVTNAAYVVFWLIVVVVLFAGATFLEAYFKGIGWLPLTYLNRVLNRHHPGPLLQIRSQSLPELNQALAELADKSGEHLQAQRKLLLLDEELRSCLEPLVGRIVRVVGGSKGKEWQPQGAGKLVLDPDSWDNRILTLSYPGETTRCRLISRSRIFLASGQEIPVNKLVSQIIEAEKLVTFQTELLRQPQQRFDCLINGLIGQTVTVQSFYSKGMIWNIGQLEACEPYCQDGYVARLIVINQSGQKRGWPVDGLTTIELPVKD